ncbi:MAG: DnaA/Hda family protein [Alphaproteobacteria bacterium]
MTQLALDLGHRAAFDADNFLIAPCNRDAVMWVDRWPAWPAPALVVHGPPACGKTHLAHVWQARSGARTVAADQLSGAAPGALLSEGSCAVVEGGDHVTDEAALMHLYNVAAEAGGQLLINAATPPARWSLSLADLRSRLVAAPAVAIGPPDDGLIAALLIKLFDDRQLRVSDGVVEFLLARMERSFEAARRLVTALDEAALANRRNITVPLARQVLDDLDNRQ